MVNRVGNRITWRDLDDLQKVKVVLRVFFTTHDQNVFEALVIIGTIQGRTVAHAVELEPFEGFDNRTRVEAASAAHCICIEYRLNIAGVCCL